MHHQHTRALALPMALVLLIALASPALSAEKKEKDSRPEYTLAPVVTTAEKRKENIQDVPASIAAISDVTIEDASMTSTEDALASVPNIHLTRLAGHSGISFINSRGVSGSTYAGSNGTALYVDGAYFAGGVDTDLLDVERIEVLRGPQGTLYGRNTQAGVVSIISKKPGNEWEGKASADIGNYASMDYRASAGGPIIADTLFLRIAGRLFESDGYLVNKFNDNHIDARNDKMGRLALRWTPTDRIEVNLSTDTQSYSGSYGGYIPMDKMRERPHEVNYNFDGSAEQDSNSQILRAEYSHPRFTLTSVSTRRRWKSDEWTDLDFSPADIMYANYFHESTGYSQELRIASSDEKKTDWKWLLGTYLFNEKFTTDYLTSYRQGVPAFGIPPFENYKYNVTETNGYAVFGQTTYTLFDKLDLTAGLRYDYEEKDFKYKEHNIPDLSAARMPPRISAGNRRLFPRPSQGGDRIPMDQGFHDLCQCRQGLQERRIQRLQHGRCRKALRIRILMELRGGHQVNVARQPVANQPDGLLHRLAEQPGHPAGHFVRGPHHQCSGSLQPRLRT